MQALYRLTLVLLLCSCTTEEVTESATDIDTYFSIPIDGDITQLQLALTEYERNKGLMHRSELAENHGMLFLFESPGRRYFWMRNTHIPLDLAFFDAHGKLLEIHSLYPHDENTVQSYSGEILIAVEMNQGWFSRKNITPGAKLDIEALVQAVDKRGRTISVYSIKVK